MKTRMTLYADEGMILTDGEHFGTIIHLEVGADASKYHEITREEYEELALLSSPLEP
ncbi:MAG: hypothetical protein J6B12_03530 [Clostridia bacterium]|nr:hypothetical protein [Clostridia bacterium]